MIEFLFELRKRDFLVVVVRLHFDFVQIKCFFDTFAAVSERLKHLYQGRQEKVHQEEGNAHKDVQNHMGRLVFLLREDVILVIFDVVIHFILR